MSDGLARHAWSLTSAIMALMANQNRTKESDRVFAPDDFNPFAEKKEPQAGDIAALREFCKGFMPCQPQVQ
jgi:hypothetical protein